MSIYKRTERSVAASNKKQFPEPTVEQAQGLFSLRAVLMESKEMARNISRTRFTEIEGTVYYRHWHFPGSVFPGKLEVKAGEEVLIPTVQGAHGTRLITEEYKKYIQEQEGIRSEFYVSLNTLKEMLKNCRNVPEINDTYMRNNKEEVNGETFIGYFAITEPEQSREKRFQVIKSENDFYFRKEDAEVIVANETEKKERYVYIGDAKRKMGVSFNSIHCRIKTGSLKAVRCGYSWYIRKDSFERAIKRKTVDQDIPENKVPLTRVNQIMEVGEGYLEDKTFKEEGKEYFLYDRIKKGKIVSEKIRIYVDNDNRKYISQKDEEYLQKCETEIKKWLTIDQAAEMFGLSPCTITSRCKKGVLSVALGRIRHVEVDYLVHRKTVRFNPKQCEEAKQAIARFAVGFEEGKIRELRTRGLSSIPGSEKVIPIHVDERQETIHITEVAKTVSGRTAYEEHYFLGVPCKIKDYTTNRKGTTFKSRSVYFEQKDAQILEFYVGLHNEDEHARKKLLDIVQKTVSGKTLSIEELIMLCIARCRYMTEADEFIAGIFEMRDNNISGFEMRENALQNKAFNERSMARIPKRYWIYPRQEAKSAAISSDSTIYPNHDEH